MDLLDHLASLHIYRHPSFSAGAFFKTLQHHPRAVRGPSSSEEGSRRPAKAPLLIQEGRRDRGGGGYKPQTAGVVTSRKPRAWLRAANRGRGYEPQTAGVVTRESGS